MEQLKKWASEFAVSLRSAVLSHLAQIVVLGLVALVSALVPALRTWIFAEQAIHLPRYVWVLLAAAIALLGAAEFRRGRIRRRARVTWRDYRKDIVDGVLWVWTWQYVNPETADIEDIERLAYALVPLCPDCEANLNRSHDELTCPNGHTRKLLPRTYDHNEYHHYAERIAAEIVRRARSGEYRRALDRR